MMRTITRRMIHELIDEATHSERKRTIYRLHEHEEPVQRMVNALVPGTYVTPHKHENPDKVELMSILVGQVALIQFTDEGAVDEVHIIGEHEDKQIVDIPPRTYHTMVALEPSAVLEIIQGPYDAATHKQFADFAPKEGEDGIVQYLHQLESAVRHEQGFFRTHKTDLSDDELILLDVFFDIDSSLASYSMRQERFGMSFNRASHYLSDDELETVLADMASRGLLNIEEKADKHGTIYSMTQAGLDLWILEREPDWTIFCSSYSDFTSDDAYYRTNIACASQDIIKAFLDAMIESGLYPAHTTIIETIEYHDVNDFVSGQHFDTLYEIRYSFGEDSAPAGFPAREQGYRTRGEYLDEKQIWWRNTKELMRLKNRSLQKDKKTRRVFTVPFELQF